jgi:hypothetical protein
MEEKSLSWWGDVTTGNKEEVISKNKEIIGTDQRSSQKLNKVT